MNIFSKTLSSEQTLFVQRIGLTGIARVVWSLRGLVTLPILTKSVSVADYGVWAQILVTLSLIQPLASLGLVSSITRFLSSKGKGEISQGILTMLLVVVLSSSFVAVIMFLLSGTIANNLLQSESAIGVVELASLLVLLEAPLAIALGSFRILGQIKRYSFLLFLWAALEISLCAFFVLSGHGLMGAVTGLIITRLGVLIGCLFLIFSYCGFMSPNFRLLPTYLIYGLPVIPTLIMSIIIEISDRYVIGHFMGSASVGEYSAPYSIGALVPMVGSFIVYILAPTVFNLYDKGKIDQARYYLSYSWKYLLLFAIPIAFGLSILSKPLLSIMTTTEFVSAGTVIVPLVAFGTLFYSAREITTQVVLISKNTKTVAGAFAACGALNLGLNILLVPRWGIVAAAITTLLSYMILAIIMHRRANKILRFDINASFIMKSIISSIVMTIVIWAIQPSGIVTTGLSIIVGAFTYFAVLFLLKGLNRNELRFARNVLRGSATAIRIRRQKPL